MLPISLCMIVRDCGKYINELFDSLREHQFEEIIIVDTGSKDDTHRVIKKAIDGMAKRRHYLDYTDVPSDGYANGTLMNFSAARNLGWRKATSPFIMWLDSDDLILKGHGDIQGVLDEMNAAKVDIALCPYNYSTGPATGLVTQRLYRERIVRQSADSFWINPVHEHLRTRLPVKFIQSEKFTVSHNRQQIQERFPEHYDKSRNLKILENWKDRDRKNASFSEYATDAHRMFFYLAFESPSDTKADRLTAIERWCQYLDIVPWSPVSQAERTVALISLAQVYYKADKPALAKETFTQAYVENPRSHEALLGLAKVAFYEKKFELAIYHAQLVLDTGQDPALTRFMTDPTISTIKPYYILVPASLSIGDKKAAIEHARQAYVLAPTDETIQHLFKELVDPSPVEATGQESLSSFRIPATSDIDAPPVSIPENVMDVFAIQIWKRIKAASGSAAGLNFLRSLPPDINSSKAIAEILRTAPQNEPRIEDAAKALQAHLPPRPASSAPAKPISVTIWTGAAWEPWSPDSINQGGIGGSETAAYMMARELAAQGCVVKLLSDTKIDEDRDNVAITNYTRATKADFLCDILICSRQAVAVNHINGMTLAKKRILWIHDVHAGEPSPDLNRALAQYAKIFCLSQWHKEFLSNVYKNYPASDIFVTRNGLDLSRFVTVPRDIYKKDQAGDLRLFPSKDGNRIIYSSSPDRGLELLLAYLPLIRKEVPDVFLDVYYGFTTWKEMAVGAKNQQMVERIQKLEDALREMQSLGQLEYHGRVGQQELAAAFMRAKVWTYPTWFMETSCISAMEAQAAGCVPVAAAMGALPETIHHGFVLKPPATSEEFQNAFVSRVVSLLKDNKLREKYAEGGRQYAFEHHAWSKVATQWIKQFRTMLSDDTQEGTRQ